MTRDAEIGVLWPQAKECRQARQLEEASDGFSPRASGGNTALATPRFQPRDTYLELLASRTVRELILLL